MKANNFLALLCVAGIAVANHGLAAPDATSQIKKPNPKASIVSATLPEGATVSYGKPVWNKAVDGIQAGISFSPGSRKKHNRYRNGDKVYFNIILKNVSHKPVTIHYGSDSSGTTCNSNVTTQALDEKGRTLYLDYPVINGCLYSEERTIVIKPHKTQCLWYLAHVRLGSLQKGDDRALRPFFSESLPAGKYKIYFDIDFLANRVHQESGSWQGELKTKSLEFEVLADENKPRHDRGSK